MSLMYFDSGDLRSHCKLMQFGHADVVFLSILSTSKDTACQSSAEILINGTCGTFDIKSN